MLEGDTLGAVIDVLMSAGPEAAAGLFVPPSGGRRISLPETVVMLSYLNEHMNDFTPRDQTEISKLIAKAFFTFAGQKRRAKKRAAQKKQNETEQEACSIDYVDEDHAAQGSTLIATEKKKKKSYFRDPHGALFHLSQIARFHKEQAATGWKIKGIEARVEVNLYTKAGVFINGKPIHRIVDILLTKGATPQIPKFKLKDNDLWVELKSYGKNTAKVKDSYSSVLNKVFSKPGSKDKLETTFKRQFFIDKAHAMYDGNGGKENNVEFRDKMRWIFQYYNKGNFKTKCKGGIQHDNAGLGHTKLLHKNNQIVDTFFRRNMERNKISRGTFGPETEGIPPWLNKDGFIRTIYGRSSKEGGIDKNERAVVKKGLTAFKEARVQPKESMLEAYGPRLLFFVNDVKLLKNNAKKVSLSQ